MTRRADLDSGGVVMGDRIKLNTFAELTEFGPLDEVFISGCDVHLEQMHKGAFVMILRRGEEEMRVSIYAPGRGSVHAKFEIDSGFVDLKVEG